MRGARITIIVLLLFLIGMDISQFFDFVYKRKQYSNYLHIAIVRLNNEIDERLSKLENIINFRNGGSSDFQSFVHSLESSGAVTSRYFAQNEDFINLRNEERTNLDTLVKKYTEGKPGVRPLVLKVYFIEDVFHDETDSIVSRLTDLINFKNLVDFGINLNTPSESCFGPTDVIIKQEAEDLIHFGAVAPTSRLTKCTIRVDGGEPERWRIGNYYIIKKKKHIFVESQLVEVNMDCQLDTFTNYHTLELVWSDSHYMPFQYPRW